MADTPAPAATPPRPLAIRLAKAVSAVVGFIAVLLGLIFLLWPSLKPEPPSPTRDVKLSHLTLERPVTFGAYLRRINQSAGGLEPAVLKQAGALAAFDFTVEGYKDRRLPLAWQLVDAGNGEKLDGNRDLSIKPEVTKDSGNWPLWVPLPKGHPRRLFIEIQLYEPRGVVALGSLRTRTFTSR
jgi:hypothetical protein